jgi:hypothetical protein
MTEKISFEINTEKTLEAILYIAQKLGGREFHKFCVND